MPVPLSWSKPGEGNVLERTEKEVGVRSKEAQELSKTWQLL